MELNNIVWPVVVLIISIVFIIAFRKDMSKKIRGLTELTIGKGKAKFFSEEISKAKPKADKIGAELNLPDKSYREQTISERELVTLASRDIVLVSWGRMKQQLIDVVSTKEVAPDNTESVVNVLANLSRVVRVPEEVHYLIVFLDQLGEDLARRTAELPDMEDAITYAKYVGLVMTWLQQYVSDPKGGDVAPKEEVKVAPRTTDTTISSSFPEPSVGAPAAVLLGMSGPVNGQRFAIAQRQVRIGSESDNDLKISGDSSVSHHHAIVRYDSGLLLIKDSGSTNGTFLNSGRLKPGEPRTLKIGDQIKMGESLLEVSSG